MQMGDAVILQADTNEGVRTLSGMAIGILIGALAGPVGVVAGLFTGTLAGMALEDDHYGFTEDFTSKVLAPNYSRVRRPLLRKWTRTMKSLSTIT